MKFGILIFILLWPAAAFTAVQDHPGDPKSIVCVSNQADRMVAYFISDEPFVYAERESQPQSWMSTHNVRPGSTICQWITPNDIAEVHAVAQLVELPKDITLGELMRIHENEPKSEDTEDGTQAYPLTFEMRAYFFRAKCAVAKHPGRHFFTVEETDNGIMCNLESESELPPHQGSSRKTKSPEKAHQP